MPDKPIIESLRMMKIMAINMGQKLPFIARMSKAAWDDLVLELGTGAVVYLTKPLEKGGRPKIEGIEIHVFDNNEEMSPFILYNPVNGISICHAEPEKRPAKLQTDFSALPPALMKYWEDRARNEL
jgi:hypothetical protein